MIKPGRIGISFLAMIWGIIHLTNQKELATQEWWAKEHGNLTVDEFLLQKHQADAIAAQQAAEAAQRSILENAQLPSADQVWALVRAHMAQEEGVSVSHYECIPLKIDVLRWNGDQISDGKRVWEASWAGVTT